MKFEIKVEVQLCSSKLKFDLEFEAFVRSFTLKSEVVNVWYNGLKFKVLSRSLKFEVEV